MVVSSCLTPEQAATYGHEQSSQLDEHLQSCSTCREVVKLVAMARTHEPGDPEYGEDLEPGHRFASRYLVIEKIGAGGLGAVYRARDTTLDRDVAIKVLHAAFAGDTLADEARVLAKLNHSNIVGVFDVATFGETTYLAMELVDGSTLARWRRSATRKRIIEVFAAIAAGVEAAHQQGIVHRDIKPDNVLIGDGDVPKVSDFGLARSDRAVAAGDITTTGSVAGTPAYMAPEQFLGEPADARSDQFSLAILLCEAITGERPFRGDTVLALHQSVVSGAPDEQVLARLPSRLRPVIARALAREPSERFASVAQFAQAVAHATRPRRKKLLLAVGAGAAGIATMLALWSQPDAVACPASRTGLQKFEEMSAQFADSQHFVALETQRHAARIMDIRRDVCRSFDARQVSVRDAQQQHDCLAEQERILEQVAQQFAHSANELDLGTVLTAIEPERCATPERVRASFVARQPTSRKLRDDMWRILASTSEADVHKQLEPILQAAQQHGDKALEAELRLELAHRAYGDAAVAYLHRALELADELGLDHLRARIVVTQAVIHIDRQNAPAYLAIADQAKALVRRFEWDPSLRMNHLSGRAAWHIAQVQLQNLEASVEEFCSVADKHGALGWRAQCQFYRYVSGNLAEDPTDDEAQLAHLHKLDDLLKTHSVSQADIVFATRVAIAQKLVRLERNDEALAASAAALALANTRFGEDSWEQMQAQSTAAALLSRPDRIARLRRILARAEQTFGKGSYPAQTTRAFLASEVYWSGDFESARVLWQELVDLTEETSFHSRHYYDEAYNMLAGLLLAVDGKADEAEKIFRVVATSPYRKHRVNSHAMLGLIAVRQSDYDGAMAAWRAGHADSKTSSQHAMMAVGQASGLFQLKRYREAYDYTGEVDASDFGLQGQASLRWLRARAAFNLKLPGGREMLLQAYQELRDGGVPPNLLAQMEKTLKDYDIPIPADGKAAP